MMADMMNVPISYIKDDDDFCAHAFLMLNMCATSTALYPVLHLLQFVKKKITSTRKKELDNNFRLIKNSDSDSMTMIMIVSDS